MTQEEIIAKAYQAYPEDWLIDGHNKYDVNKKCREGYIRALTELNIDAIRGEAMHKVADGYEALPSIEGWFAARNENGDLHIFEVEPRRFRREWWDRDYDSLSLNKECLPDLTWDDEPIRVKLLIKKVL